MTVVGLCVLLQAAAAGVLRGHSMPESTPGIDAAENSRQMIRIRRLRPADPESREIMLVDRGWSVGERPALMA